jgi:hypothetical protein
MSTSRGMIWGVGVSYVMGKGEMRNVHRILSGKT